MNKSTLDLKKTALDQPQLASLNISTIKQKHLKENLFVLDCTDLNRAPSRYDILKDKYLSDFLQKTSTLNTLKKNGIISKYQIQGENLLLFESNQKNSNPYYQQRDQEPVCLVKSSQSQRTFVNNNKSNLNEYKSNNSPQFSYRQTRLLNTSTLSPKLQVYESPINKSISSSMKRVGLFSQGNRAPISSQHQAVSSPINKICSPLISPEEKVKNKHHFLLSQYSPRGKQFINQVTSFRNQDKNDCNQTHGLIKNNEIKSNKSEIKQQSFYKEESNKNNQIISNKLNDSSYQDERNENQSQKQISKEEFMKTLLAFKLKAESTLRLEHPSQQSHA